MKKAPTFGSDFVLSVFICVSIYEFVYDLIKGIQGFKTCTRADSLLFASKLYFIQATAHSTAKCDACPYWTTKCNLSKILAAFLQP